MKKIITIGVFFALFACVHVFGQHLAVTCSSIEVRGVTFPTNLFHERQNSGTGIPVSLTGCVYTANGSLGAISTVFSLDKIDNNGTVISSSGSQNSPVFNNLQQGTYIPHFSTPTMRNSFNCPNGYGVVDLIGRQIGFMADFGFPTSMGQQVIGVPAASDNNWQFLDGNNRTLFGSTQFISYYDPSEPIRINATTCQNFDRYGIAIQEFWGGNQNQPGRWRSLNTSVPSNMVNGSGLIDRNQRPLGVEDLRRLWDPTGIGPNWQFIPGNSYRVQVTLSNSTCASWIDNLQTFNICDPLWQCRTGNEPSKIEPSISPNPVSRTFKMDGITFNPVSNVKDELVIHDLTGRLVKNFNTIQSNEFDVSDLSTGVYFGSVLRDDHKLFTKKLMVSH